MIPLSVVILKLLFSLFSGSQYEYNDFTLPTQTQIDHTQASQSQSQADTTYQQQNLHIGHQQNESASSIMHGMDDIANALTELNFDEVNDEEESAPMKDLPSHSC
eukprot:Pgem_evm1s8874